ncbi:polysaccharide deacetylase family protein [Sporosarcina sp. CAU 1771]
MVKRLIALCVVLAIGLIVGSKEGVASDETNKYIGLHDRIVQFSQTEIHEVDMKVFVPFDKLMKNLYAEVTYEDQISATKNSQVIAYENATKITYLNGEEIEGAPLRDIEGQLHADLAFVVKSYGFHFEYFPEFNLSRIFSDSYKSLKGIEYENHIRKTLKLAKPSIGLHDRLLGFANEDIRSVNGKIVVPFNQLMTYLYAEVKQGDTIQATKNKHVLSYNQKTGATLLDGNPVAGSPIFPMNNTLYVDIAFITTSFGFHFDHVPEVNVFRIYSDTYKSLRGTAYANHVQLLKQPVVPKPIPKPAPKPVPPVKASKATVYLTFDDGPNPITTKNAAILKKYNVQGTFFFLGKQMNAYPGIVKEIAKEGHYIGSHSMTHEKNKVYASSTSFMNEMKGGSTLIHKLTGSNPTLIRVPYGSQPHVTPSMVNEMKKNKLKMWDWDVDSNDWRYSDKQYVEIARNVRNGVNRAYNSGDRDIVVLLHDRSQTAIALPHIIEWLLKEGYTLKTYDPAHHVVQNFHRNSGL